MDSTAAEAKYKKRDDASARLGEKLLQGWTMLGVHCPSDECFTPLVRNKQGQMFCVSCNRFAITEEEAKKQQEEQEAKEREEQQQLEAAKAAQEQLARQQAERERHWQIQQQQQQAAVTPARATPVANGPVKRTSADAALSTAGDDEFVQACRRQTLAAMYKKLEELTNSISTTDHLERVLSTTKAINELANAIQTLSSSN
ncbi:hypothetical protein Poli38472_006628 [Pythium oligandrum]|uniref:Sjoegren syndrome/scleroderma autoantigen 1 n=1 Tax=Pythium oligandrum TaxID=41045 RepID=A0A8K1C5E5_PYTOL|nr:hypothetical protein Poli38472_006628 [Pythium oligandrum]|eukprot:TMW56618.1 hypothetical protein Poli38472_006628 [Pythium oligandrum]